MSEPVLGGFRRKRGPSKETVIDTDDRIVLSPCDGHDPVEALHQRACAVVANVLLELETELGPIWNEMKQLSEARHAHVDVEHSLFSAATAQRNCHMLEIANAALQSCTNKSIRRHTHVLTS